MNWFFSVELLDRTRNGFFWRARSVTARNSFIEEGVADGLVCALFICGIEKAQGQSFFRCIYPAKEVHLNHDFASVLPDLCTVRTCFFNIYLTPFEQSLYSMKRMAFLQSGLYAFVGEPAAIAILFERNYHDT